MNVLPRPQKRKHGHGGLRHGKPFYWSAGSPPTTERGKRRHAARTGVRKDHATLVHQGKVVVIP